MKKLILASVSALALFGVAACSDSGTDNTTTESTNPPATEQPAAPPANDTMQPDTGTGTDGGTMQPAAPAQ
ncbi:hypothetical protein [Manganibacter manganicus]|jgi:hypothetical protein|uniref:Immunogenic protein n=1 Tax=Manganibacter manganicus TaxID=1873176 RepID=A0A1V8RVX2_9HYPH|nr:hypothetical protein [Pseudaminobacter manganicus]OQM77337.1 hypothetical protein BFN67_00345 [Pseudaminobacter manganicus]